MASSEVQETPAAPSIDLTAEQRSAVEIACTARLSLITGGPGTGKTTTIRAMVEAFRARSETFMLLAPTGKAASRIASHLGERSSTIHRALQWCPNDATGDRYYYCASRPWAVDVVVLDEASMVDAATFEILTDAIGTNTRLVMVGDPNQLPPVGPGAPLVDLLGQYRVPRVHLRAPFRQTLDSPITAAAWSILAGEVPPALPTAPVGPLYLFLPRVAPYAGDTVVQLVRDHLPRRLGPDASIQVLTPTKGTGLLGAMTLNDSLARVLNPVPRDALLMPGDRIIQTANNYRLEVFNGDVGSFLSLFPKGGALVEFNGKQLEVTERETRDLLLAYALTVHRSQGSEYDAVVVLVDESHGRCLHRQLIYTAITRARHACVVVGTSTAMAKAVDRLLPSRDTWMIQKVMDLRREKLSKL